MRRARPLRARGQATVELAIGSTVFVIVLLVGIHLSEVAALSLKVQEAQAFAVWESTARRVQTREVSGATSDSPFSGTPGAAQAEATQRYRDFNGLSSSHGPAVISQSMTEGSKLEVRCSPGSLSFPSTPATRAIFHDVGALSCSASASLQAVRMPKSFLQRDDGAFFANEPFRTQPMQVCGLGLPSGGACSGALAILTNDWGFTSEKETAQCKNGCAPTPYKGAVKKVFDDWAGGWTAGKTLAETWAGPPGSDATEFNFSYSGIESSYKQVIASEGDLEFQTGGPDVSNGMIPQATTGAKCFLGMPGCQ